MKLPPFMVAVVHAWNATNDPREVIKAVEGDEEHIACMFDGI